MSAALGTAAAVAVAVADAVGVGRGGQVRGVGRVEAAIPARRPGSAGAGRSGCDVGAACAVGPAGELADEAAAEVTPGS